jgi:hypothetical protein
MWSSARLGGGEVELSFRPVFRGEDQGREGEEMRKTEETRSRTMVYIRFLCLFSLGTTFDIDVDR